MVGIKAKNDALFWKIPYSVHLFQGVLVHEWLRALLLGH
jgi:hypothetical protein